jgi:hypothetical protein
VRIQPRHRAKCQQPDGGGEESQQKEAAPFEKSPSAGAAQKLLLRFARLWRRQSRAKRSQSFLLPRAGRLFFKKEALLSSFITPLYPPVPIPRNATLRSKLTHQKSFAR